MYSLHGSKNGSEYIGTYAARYIVVKLVVLAVPVCSQPSYEGGLLRLGGPTTCGVGAGGAPGWWCPSCGGGSCSTARGEYGGPCSW